MVKARLTSKGQITIPKVIRDRLGIQPGDVLLFSIRGNRVEVTAGRRQSVAALAGLFPMKRAVKDERVRSWTAEIWRVARRRRVDGSVAT